jgi:hypothetical protein
MRDDFAVLIITHGRPDNQLTLETLKRENYSGQIYLVVDDEDETKERYIQQYGAEKIKIFHKIEWFDIGDNFYDKKNSSVYARNECFRIAKEIGLKYFVEMDDDFTDICYRYADGDTLRSKRITNLDEIFEAFCEFLEVEPITCLSFAVQGDMIGGVNGKFKEGLIRRARNTFFCKVEKPFEFKGRFEDITTPTWYNSIGEIFATVTAINIAALDKEKNHGGMAEMKNQNITYWERFYAIMWMPSAIRVSRLDAEGNHREYVQMNNIIPKILNERYKKGAK